MMKMMEEICYGMTYHDNMSNDHSDNDDDYDGNYCTYFGNFTDICPHIAVTITVITIMSTILIISIV